MHLVVGLGNPGGRYARTRHNVGFLVAERVAARTGASIERKLFGALVGEGSVGGQKVVFAEPQQFMNLSGQAVASLVGFYKLPAEQVVVVHDEMDLPFTRLRVRPGGGHGGHNGIRDVQRALGNGFTRVRVGVGRPPAGWDPADYVLATWSAEEQAELDSVVDTAADAVECVVRDGVQAAMNRFNPSEPARGAGRPASSSAEGPALPSIPSSKRKAS